MPSRRTHTWRAAVSASPPRSISGRVASTRSTNSVTASSTGNDDNGITCSPRTPSASRPVASTRTVGHDARTATTSFAGDVEHVLAVVQHDQRLPAGQTVTDRLDRRTARAPAGTPSASKHDRRHGIGRRRHRQVTPPRPIGELAGQAGRHLERQACLAHAAHPDDRHDRMGQHRRRIPPSTPHRGRPAARRPPAAIPGASGPKVARHVRHLGEARTNERVDGSRDVREPFQVRPARQDAARPRPATSR